MVEKSARHICEEEEDVLAAMLNDSFYNGRCSDSEIHEIFFSRDDMYNFIAEDDGEVVGVFQALDLPKIDCFYLYADAIRKDHRGRNIYPWSIDYRINHAKSLGRSYMGLRSMNPLALCAMVDKGFYLPVERNEELLRKAKEMLVEVEGSDLEIGDNFVIPRKAVSKYPNVENTGRSYNPVLSKFIKENMDIAAGDRLFLVKKLI